MDNQNLTTTSAPAQTILDVLINPEHGAIIPYRVEKSNNIICLIHGFSGKANATFGRLPELIIQENSLDGWDVISIGYASNLLPNIAKGIWVADPDLNKVARYLQTNLESLFKGYKRVALIGHSMGGLVIQRALLNLSDLSKVSHVLFFGTPSAGLKKAWLFRWFKNQISDMDYTGIFIKNLRAAWNERFVEVYPFEFRTVAGERDEFVPVESSVKPFSAQYHRYTSGNHLTMVKPLDSHDPTFKIIRDVLYFENEYLMGGNDKELNNLVGNYYEDLSRLEPMLSSLDLNGLRKYIFALEGTGKLDAAIETLLKSEKLDTQTDLMGILGGRWKRKYLTGDSSTDLTSAIYWYKRAFDASEKNKNYDQAYYHAINLAFLHLMENDQELTKVKEMARLALNYCELSSEGSSWEIATKAEANLYLNDFEASKKLYSEAVRICNHDIRSISSMMINAVYACNRLNKLDWKEELMVVFQE